MMAGSSSIRVICYYACLVIVSLTVFVEATDSAKSASHSYHARRIHRRHRKAATTVTAVSSTTGSQPHGSSPTKTVIESLSQKIHFPAKLNPLLDQPNLSVKDPTTKDEVLIYGSRKAFTVTRMQYLKKEWCKTEMLKQVIREEGCLRRTIINRFCYGQCNSFFIPKSDKKDMESGAFKSCAFCKPKRYSYITVTLNCPGKRPRYKRKRVQRIKQCKCMAQNLD